MAAFEEPFPDPPETASNPFFEALFDDLMSGELTELEEEALLGEDFYRRVA
jgi:hypothetical protein